MSDSKSRDDHSKRLYADEVKIKKQLRIAKQKGMHDTNMVKQPHRMAKRHAMDCGNPSCGLCGNPRKLFKELTHQENKLYQVGFYKEDDSHESDDT
jgi:hypothetical protein